MPDGTGNAYSDQAYAYTVASYAYTTSPGRDVTITLYAQWEEDTYNVNFNSNNGTGETKVQEMLFDVVTELDENSFTWPGYAFQGWSETRGGAVQYADRAEVENFYEKDAAGDLAGEKTLYAVWAESQYKVRFMKNGVDAKETMADQEFTYDDSQRLRRVAFTRERYAFTGWNTMPDGTGTSFDDQAFGYQIATEEADGIVVLYAQWAAESYNIHFVGNGGHSADENSGSGGQTNEIIVVRKTQTVGYGLTVKLDENDFLRTGYAFTGWSESRDGSDKTHYEDCAEVTDFYNADGTEKVLYAQWEPVSYTVRFNPNCDDYTGGPMPDQTFTYGEYSNLARNTFKREGWVFAGWNTSSDGEGGVWLARRSLRV